MNLSSSRSHSRFRLPATAVCAALAAATVPVNAAILYGPSAYLAFDNTLPGAGLSISPFASQSFSYFHLETFEDGLLNTPGVSASAGSVYTGFNLDSVDADDGVINGSGSVGHSFLHLSGPVATIFTFNAVALGGALPTHAGIVWTDGGGPVTFQAFGPGNSLLGTIVGSGFADAGHNGGTAEDRFFGISDVGGISSISIFDAIGAIEVDHLQYGLATAVPEPSTYAAGLAVLGAVGGAWWRNRRRA